MKKKIAIFHCGFIYSGGGERIVLEQAKGLRKLGYDVVVFAPTLDRKKCYPDLLNEISAQTFFPQLPSFAPARFAFSMVLSSILAPFFAFRFTDVDIFIGANQPGAWIAFCIAKVLNKPYAVYMNQPNRLLYPREIDKKVGWATTVHDYQLLYRLTQLCKPFIAWADKISFTSGKYIFVNGEYMKKIIEKIYGKKTVNAPAGAYHFPKHLLYLNPHTAYEGKVTIGKHIIEKPYALIANRHDPQKRFDYVIEALAKVSQNYPKAKLVIPGPFTQETRKLQKLVKKLRLQQHVLFLGQITDKQLQLLYQHAVMHCYPSPEEDFGLGPLEAGGWGVPTVAWNVAGPTVTVVNGVTGILAKPYDVSDYANKMLFLFTRQKERAIMGEAAWERTKKQFSWERHVAVLEDALFANVIA